MSGAISCPARIEQARGCDILEVAERLGVQLKKLTATERAGPCPMCGGEDRFAINTSKRIFNCRGFGGGDVIAMVQHVGGLDFGEALDFIVRSFAGDTFQECRDHVKARLGIEGVFSPTLGKTRLTEKAVQVAQVSEDAQRIARALTVWREGVDPRGTVAETYLRGRGLDLADDLAGAVIRFHPRCPWRDDDGAIIRVPAMICALRNINSDAITAISRRRLTAAGEKVGKPKFMGVAAGAAIKLDADDTVTGGLHIGEGVETCLAARQLGLRPVWALASAGAIAGFPVLAGVECLTILAEHDAASAKAVQACAQRWHDAAREVLINRPTRGKDLNDAIRGAA